jgi:hypothetical protein
METFQKIVLYSAIIILIISLIFVGIALSLAKSKENWPPLVPDCPDYWTIDGSGNNTKCINVQNLGICPAPSGQKYLVMDFNSPVFSGSNSSCAKYTWANKCNVAWDGITYGVGNPCSK